MLQKDKAKAKTHGPEENCADWTLLQVTNSSWHFWSTISYTQKKVSVNLPFLSATRSWERDCQFIKEIFPRPTPLDWWGTTSSIGPLESMNDHPGAGKGTGLHFFLQLSSGSGRCTSSTSGMFGSPMTSPAANWPPWWRSCANFLEGRRRDSGHASFTTTLHPTQRRWPRKHSKPLASGFYPILPIPLTLPHPISTSTVPLMVPPR